MEPAFIERKEIERQEYQKQIKKIPYEHRIYVDETGMYEHPYKTHGWAKKGKKIFAKVHGQKGKRMNVIGAIRNNKFIAHQEIVGSVNSEKFVKFISKAIIPHLKNGDFVIMDNAKIHTSKKNELKKMIEGKGGKLLFLPPYSPDFNPIEHCWGTLKTVVKSIRHLFDSLSTTLMHYFSKRMLELN